MSHDPGFIALHHIGARGGTGTVQVPASFGADVHQVFYEADAACGEQIQAAQQGKGLAQVLPLCIGASQGRSAFHIDYDPFMSSLFELNPAYDDYTLFLVDPLKGAMDYRFGDSGRVVETRQLEVVSLDGLYAADAEPAPPPDLLSMDTQGSEYEILCGASKTLASSVLALRLEVAFRPIYQGQKLFGDLCTLLASQGFEFVKMLEVFEMYPYRDPVGLRAGSYDAFGEALFFRTPQALAAECDPCIRYLKRFKLAFIALLHGQLGTALHCLRALGPLPEELRPVLARRAYPAFLLGLAERAAAHPRSFPPLFSECYSVQESMARFDGDFPTMEDRFVEVLAQLRHDVAALGGSRLCLMPFGFYARKAMDWPSASGMVPLAFFDNGFARHQAAGIAVDDPALLRPDDYVVILSQSYGVALERQLEGIRGAQPERTLSYRDLIAGRRAFRQRSEPSAVEAWLAEHGFEGLAKQVQEQRIAQTID